MIGVIDYGASNLESVCNALRVLNQPFRVMTGTEALGRCAKIILPGVGAAGKAMEKIREIGFDRAIPSLGVPFLGICLGLQLLADFSEEGNVSCLSIVPGKVRRFGTGLKVPQIGWNAVRHGAAHPLFSGIPSGSYFYFVNSYYFDAEERFVLARTDYGTAFPSALSCRNFLAVQFHPEKSGEIGLKLLENFCTRC